MWTNALFSFFLPLAPAAAPGGLAGQNDTSTSVSVSWQALPKTVQNGIIKNYTLYYRVRLTTGKKSTIQTSPPALNARITGLLIYTEYTISVSASTSAGEGPDSDDIFVRTGEASKLTDGGDCHCTG